MGPTEQAGWSDEWSEWLNCKIGSSIFKAIHFFHDCNIKQSAQTLNLLIFMDLCATAWIYEDSAYETQYIKRPRGWDELHWW